MSSKEREGGEVAGVWANGEQLILQVMMMIMIIISMMANGEQLILQVEMMMIMIMISMMANGKQLTLQLVDEAIFVTITLFSCLICSSLSIMITDYL